MNKRPFTVTIIGWLMAAVGVGGFAFHLNEIKPQNVLHGGNVWIFAVEVVAIACGAFVLRGNNWARWLALAWVVFHVAFSIFSPFSAMKIHSLILLLFTCLLFLPQVNAFFNGEKH